MKIFSLLCICFLFVGFVNAQDTIPKKDSVATSFMAIRKLGGFHCQRGSDKCLKCKEAANAQQISLLRIYYKTSFLVRPIKQFELNGKNYWLEYDIVSIFNSKEDALKFAVEKGIEDIKLE